MKRYNLSTIRNKKWALYAIYLTLIFISIGVILYANSLTSKGIFRSDEEKEFQFMLFIFAEISLIIFGLMWAMTHANAYHISKKNIQDIKNGLQPGDKIIMTRSTKLMFLLVYYRVTRKAIAIIFNNEYVHLLNVVEKKYTTSLGDFTTESFKENVEVTGKPNKYTIKLKNSTVSFKFNRAKSHPFMKYMDESNYSAYEDFYSLLTNEHIVYED